jgi:hypothetical protein
MYGWILMVQYAEGIQRGMVEKRERERKSTVKKEGLEY